MSEVFGKPVYFVGRTMADDLDQAYCLVVADVLRTQHANVDIVATVPVKMLREDIKYAYETKGIYTGPGFEVYDYPSIAKITMMTNLVLSFQYRGIPSKESFKKDMVTMTKNLINILKDIYVD